jgi:hypothetical protein
MKKVLLSIICAAIIIATQYVQTTQTATGQTHSTANTDLANAFINQQSNIQIQGTGTVIKILDDDIQGSKHQRFIVDVGNNQTLLIAHNIDLAPRIPRLKSGDTVEFYGEYEWNKKGGVLHWTHHDPGKRHTDGWLKHMEKTYQ